MHPRLFFTVHRRWLLALGIIAFCCAMASFTYYTEFPFIVASSRSAIDYVVTTLFFSVLALSLPLVLITSMIWPGMKTFVFIKTHAALLTSRLIILFFAFEPAYPSYNNHSVALIRLSYALVLVLELIGIKMASTSLSAAGRSLSKPPLLFRGLVAAIVGGWAAGTVIWSERLPARVLMAAEKNVPGGARLRMPIGLGLIGAAVIVVVANA